MSDLDFGNFLTQTRQSIVDSLDKLLAAYAASRQGAPAVMAVPYRSQWDEDANKRNSDCGPACVAMLLDYKGVYVAINQLGDEANMNQHPDYTGPLDLIKAAAAHQLTLTRALNITLDQLKAHVPAIVLVHYGTLHALPTQDQRFGAGHWLVVIGVNDASVIVHDPNWRGAQRNQGASLAIPRALFTQAMLDCRMDSNTPNQGLFIA